MIFFMDSMGHLTTKAQQKMKIAQAGQAPVAGSGAFGFPGTIADDNFDPYIVNYPALTTLEFSFYWKPTAQYGKLLEFYTTLGIQATLEIFGDGTFQLVRGPDSVHGGTPIGTPTPAASIAFNDQHHIKGKMVFSQTVGTFSLKVDGLEVFGAGAGLTGLDNCSQAAANCTQLRAWGSGPTNIASGVISHLMLGNASGDIIGQPKVVSVFATADGAHAAFTPVGAGAAHYDRINETTPDTTNYNKTATPGDKDSYLFANAVPAGSRILAVAIVPLITKEDASARTGRGFYREAAVDYPGVTKAIPASAGYLQDIMATNPATGVEFTPAELNAPAEFGYELVS